MNCSEFQEMFEDDRTAQQESHLRSCSACSSLVAELDLIAREAHQLQDVDEPNPRVWNSIEIALRQEGIIRDPQAGPQLVAPAPRRRSLAWLAPLAAAVLVAFGVAVYQRGSVQPASSAQGSTEAPAVARLQTGKSAPIVNNSNEDQQLLAAVASRSPTMQAQYASNLRSVNAYIRDAEESAQADPSDEEAQQIVMDAYEQRATVYELALDRSLP